VAGLKVDKANRSVETCLKDSTVFAFTGLRDPAVPVFDLQQLDANSAQPGRQKQKNSHTRLRR